MCGRAWQVTRAVLFLLFAVVLAALGPTDAALAGPACCAASSEHKPDTTEQRDNEKLRERLQGLTTHRRAHTRHEHDRHPLRGVQGGTAAELDLVHPARLPAAESDAHHACSRLRHSPATLQVMRH
ncbi:hypothetical protein EIL87_08195 [Saccharopolyspora rhizosphaerae]|uniref:Secreted protein n=1 Tax=Saccharopolyspora rhizosphaerae TaxID=2492662 RepID=A0A426JYS3_9PSEU|nr:hypothetical protein [Saccharopolyspora rhizosphaerae]RRO18212.1 hypothetical protein EIL87_08195 [Saccharopolyspora rhizosphaerae]